MVVAVSKEVWVEQRLSKGSQHITMHVIHNKQYNKQCDTVNNSALPGALPKRDCADVPPSEAGAETWTAPDELPCCWYMAAERAWKSQKQRGG